jgi:NADPH:quinone reductase-like Zn-dependent oxidoreductase
VSITAVVADPQARSGVQLATVEEPVPGPAQVVIEARHASLNRGDLNDARSGRVPSGAVLGSDVAGVVARAARGVPGPPVGARVVALVPGAFAQRVAADVDALAVVPDTVDLAQAAALPVAGVAAVQALREGMLETPIKGARVLITGASGGVGRFAVQLGAYSGAHVIAVVGDPERADELTALGAEEVCTDPAAVDVPVDLVLDTVGGPQLVAAWALLAPGGSVQCIGASSGEPSTFPAYSTVGPAKSLSSFLITAPVAPDLAALVRLVGAGTLRVPIGWRGPLGGRCESAFVGSALPSRRPGGSCRRQRVVAGESEFTRSVVRTSAAMAMRSAQRRLLGVHSGFHAVATVHPPKAWCRPRRSSRARFCAAARRLKSAAILALPRMRARRPPWR